MLLGAVLDDQAYIARDVSSVKFAQQSEWLQTAAGSLAAEQLTAPWLTAQCGGLSYSGPPMSLTALKDGGMALTMAATAGVGSSAGAFGTGALAATGAASTAFAAATFGVGIAVAIFSIISAHHAAAVGREHSLECSLVPPANYALQLIDQAVSSGQMTPAVASASLDKLHSDFVSAATGGPGGLQTNPCNAMCVLAHILQAICDKKKDQYAAMAAAPAVSSTGPTAAPVVSSGSVMVLPSAATPTPAGTLPSASAAAAAQASVAAAAASASPSWLPLAAVALVGFFVLKVF
jgi:hypothetical protein